MGGCVGPQSQGEAHSAFPLWEFLLQRGGQVLSPQSIVLSKTFFCRLSLLEDRQGLKR